jgi:predicted alpha/beta superfamily hydrolase
MKKITLFILLFIQGWMIAQPPPFQPQTSAFTIGVTQTLWSKELSEARTLNIYLPKGYNKDSALTYSVIYLLDGSADEDFIHITGLVQNFSFPWINKIKPSIVVGIGNIDRKRDFSFVSESELDKKDFPTSGGADQFISFLEKELQPFIEKNYKVNQSRTLIGQSFGGLLASTILLQHPQLFNTYIIVSPSLWWNDGSLLTKYGSKEGIAALNFQPGTKIYVGVGKEGAMPGREKWPMETVARQLATNLKESKNKNIRTYFDYLPDETHATVTHQAVYNAFKLLGEENK